MEISSILIGLVLLIASLAFVFLPFKQKQPAALKAHKVNGHHDGRRESVLSALRDLDFDFRIGKVSEEDYTPLRAQLVAEAAQYIEQEKKEEDKLESLIQTRRAVKQKTMKCEHCGAPMEIGQRFCPKCGSAVNKDLCPACGNKVRTSDQFCSSCGNRLEVKLGAVVQS